jgi:hypothetical protein
MVKTTTGYSNTALGGLSLLNNTEGHDNTAVGLNALYSNTTGYFNTALGANATVNATNRINATAIGFGAVATADNQVMLGNSAVTVVRSFGTIIVPSDGRFKKNIKENVPGLSFIKLLKPVTYNYDVHGLDKLIEPGNKNRIPDERSGKDAALQEQAITRKEKKIYTGFIAQEVETAAKKIGYDFSGVYHPQNDKDPYGLSYSDFVVPLVKAVQELSQKNDELKNENTQIEKELDDIKAMLSKLNVQPGNNSNLFGESRQSIELSSSAKLEQNIPNPFTNSTTIRYYLPVNNGNAYINFYDASGKILKSVKLTGDGKGSIDVKARELPSGIYQYSLITAGAVADSKKMVHAH